MSEKLPFEGGGLPQDENVVPGLPFAPSSEAPPLPFSLNDESPAPLPFALETESAIPPLPFSLDDEPAAAPEAAHISLDAEPEMPALPFALGEEAPAHFSLDSEPKIPPLPFSLDDEEPAHFSLESEPKMAPLPFSLDDEEPTVAASPADPAPFSLDEESKIPPLPFSLDDDEPEMASKIPPLPFSLDDDEPAVESKIPPLPFTLEDEPSTPLAAEQAIEPLAAPAPQPELTGAGFLFEEGEIDSPLFRRLAQKEEPAPARMGYTPPMSVPAMPPVAKAPSAEPPSPPPFPPAYEPARQAMEPPSPPPPPPGYQPPPPPPPVGYEPASRPLPPPAASYQPPSPMPPPAYEPPPVMDLNSYVDQPPQPMADLNAYEPMQPASNSRAPILTGAAIPQHDAPPVAKDVSSALAAMKARLTSTRQPDPNAEILKEVPADYGLDMSLAPKSSKSPEIWEYRVGQSIFREGELTFELFMLMEGIIDIYVGGDKVATLNSETAAGAYLGEVGALLRQPRTATVKAVTSCKFLVFPDAKRLFEEDPEFGIKLSTILAQRLAQNNERMEMAMRALYRAKVKDDVITAVKGAFQGKESTFVGKKRWFG